MADPDDSRLRSVLDGRYRIEARIATGGMGMVYRGERVGIGKKVAIKFLHRSGARDPQQRKRFEREAEAMSRVAHPNIASVIDHGIEDGVPYLVMEYQTGESLREVLRRGALPPERAVTIARHIAAAVAGIHAAGVIHRDLKPENVMLLAGLDHDFAKVLDFGIAKIFDSADVDFTRAGHVVGTPSYMSPEQARGAKVDHRTDIYSLGVILFEMVTGERLFEGDEDLALLRQHVEDFPRRPRAVGAGAAISPQLEEIILTALSKAPSARYQSAAALGRALAMTPEHASGRAASHHREDDGDPHARRARDSVEALPTRELEQTLDDDDEPAPRRGRGMVGLLLAVAIGVGIGWIARDPSVLDRFRSGGNNNTPARPVAALDAAVVSPNTAAADAAIVEVDVAPPLDAAPDASPDAEPLDAAPLDSSDDAGDQPLDAE